MPPQTLNLEKKDSIRQGGRKNFEKFKPKQKN